MKPHLPIYRQPGCRLLREYTERFVSGTKSGTAYQVEYLNKKNKANTCTKRVIWD